MITYVDAKQWYVETATRIHPVLALVSLDPLDADEPVVRPVVLVDGQLTVLSEYVALRFVANAIQWSDIMHEPPTGGNLL